MRLRRAEFRRVVRARRLVRNVGYVNGRLRRPRALGIGPGAGWITRGLSEAKPARRVTVGGPRRGLPARGVPLAARCGACGFFL